MRDRIVLLSVLSLSIPICAMRAFSQVPGPATSGRGAGPSEAAANGALLYDRAYPSLSAACSAATTAGKSLALTMVWKSLATQSCAATLISYGGTIQPASGQTVTFSLQNPGMVQICDISLHGTCDVKSATGIVYPEMWGDVPNSRNVDYSANITAAVESVAAVGGQVYFSASVNGCHIGRNIPILSHVTYTGDKTACVQLPAAKGLQSSSRLFTTTNLLAGGQLVSDAHLSNFTIDGNKANQTGIPIDQDGYYGILLGGCSDCSVTDMVIKNNITDGILIEGYGSQVLTVTVNTATVTCDVTNVTWSGSVGIYTCSRPHNLVTNTHVAVTDLAPGGYNIADCQSLVINATQFGCHVAANPGSFISGGKATYNVMTYVSGATFDNLQQSLLMTSAGNSCRIAGIIRPAARTVYCEPNQGTQSGAIYSFHSYAGQGDNLDIAGNLITGNGRNGISQLGGSHTHIHNNHISYSYGNGSGPWDGIDLEPFEAGAYFFGSDYIDNEFDHNGGNLRAAPFTPTGSGVEIAPECAYDPLFSPVFLNNNSHDNAVAGLKLQGPFGPASTLTVSGVFQDNGSVGLRVNWPFGTVNIPWIVTSGSPTGLDNEGAFSTVTVSAGQLSAKTYDIGFGTYPYYYGTVITGATLVEGTALPMTRVQFSSRDPGAK